jgi:hypothetical protein
MKNAPGSIVEISERNLSACEHAQADRGEYLHACFDSPPKLFAVPISSQPGEIGSFYIVGDSTQVYVPYEDATLSRLWVTFD